LKTFILAITLSFCTNVFAHGEDKYGPHNGFIHMTGSFHVELVPQKDGSFYIYLMDLQNKNPKVLDSSVEVQVKSELNTIKLNCMNMDDFFHCANPHSLKKISQLIVKPNRLGINGRDVIYQWPLELSKTKSSNHDMSKMK
jgi:hypothetical protein